MADLASFLLLLVLFFLAPAVDDAVLLADAKGSRPCCLVLLLAAPVVLARWGVLCAGDLTSSALLLWPNMDEGSSTVAAPVMSLALFAEVDSGETRLAPPMAEMEVEEVLMGEDVAIAVLAAALDVLVVVVVVVVVVAASSTWSVPVKFFRMSWALFPLPVRPCRKEIMLASSPSLLLVMLDDDDDWSAAGVRRKLTPLKVRVMDVLSSAAHGAGADAPPKPTPAVGTSDILEGMTERWKVDRGEKLVLVLLAS